MKLRLLLAFYLILPAAWGQKAHTKSFKEKEAPYSYIYKLTVTEAEKLYLYPKTELNSSFFHSCIDSFPAHTTYSKTPSPGYYLFVVSEGLVFRHQLINLSALNVHILNNGADFALHITDKNTESTVNDARITLRNKVVPFDPLTGAYVLSGRQKSGDLRIEARGETLFLRTASKLNASWKKSQGNATGFIAFNLPRYRIGDTVKLKAFINYKGKPLQEELEMKIRKKHYDWAYEKVNYKKRLSPASPGAYVCQFVLTDSFKLDETYYVQLYRTNRKKEDQNEKLFSSSFRTEDYQLDQTRYSLRMSKIYTADDTVSVFLSGTDFNGLPLFDASAEVEVTTRSVESPALESEDFAYHIYTKTLPLDPSGETRLDIPPSVFSTSGVIYECKARFRNSNNELHSDSVRFKINQQLPKLELVDMDSCFIIKYMKPGNPEKVQALVTYLGHDRDSIRTEQVQLPFQLRTSSTVRSLLVNCQGLTREFDIPFQFLHPYGYKNKDSVFAGVNNPSGKQFNFELYRAGVLIKKGHATQFKYHSADAGHASYRLITQVCDNNENRCQILNILPPEKSLQVVMQQARETWPGQEAEVKVKVLDYDARPVKDANITLDCINAQFNDKSETTLPDYNKTMELKKKQYVRYNIRQRHIQKRTAYLSYWYKRLRLDTIPFYHLHNPGESLVVHYFPVNTVEAQFAPFIVSKNEFQPIYFIFIDDKAVFALGNIKLPGTKSYYADKSPWSFLAPEGKHTIRIRTRDREYTLSSVEFHKGQKLELSFDKDHLPQGVLEAKRSKRLTEEEQKVLNDHLFVVDKLPHNEYQDQYFWQGNNFKIMRNKSLTLFQPGDTIYYQLESYSSAYKGSLVFKPGLLYTINESEVTSNAITAPIKKLQSASYYSFRNTGDTVITKSVLRKGPEFIFGDRPYGVCAEGTYTEPGNGSYALTEMEDAEVYRIELIRSDQMDAVIGFQRDWQSSFGGDKKKLENLKPGLYKATYYDEHGNYFIKHSIRIQENKMHVDKIHKADFKPFSSMKPENVSCAFYNLNYGSETMQISGTIKVPIHQDYITTYVMCNGRITGTAKCDPQGRFRFQLKEAGMYDLFIMPDTTYQNISIFGLLVNAETSPVLNIHVSPAIDTLHHYSLYNLASQGHNVEMHSRNAWGDKLPSITLNKYKSSLAPPNHWFGTRDSYINAYDYYDETHLEVDGQSVYDYRRRYHHRVHYRRRRYSSAFYSSAPAHRKFRIKENETEGFHLVDYDAVNAKKTAFAFRGNVNGDGIADPDESNVYKVQLGKYSDNVIPPIKVNNVLYDRIFDHGQNPDYMYEGPGGQKGPQQQMRKNFSDCAYWAPNLLTNDSGVVNFRFRFPDDVTGWNARALAITGNMQSGQSSAFTKSFKPLLASLNTPRFLLRGDSSEVVGKVMNYGKDPLTVKTVFRQKDRILSQTSELVTKGFNQNQLVVAPANDSLQLEYSLETKGGYSDGVQQSIPVFQTGTEESAGSFFLLEKDTTFRFSADTSGGTLEISALGNDLDLLLSKLKYINEYPYYCNEQIASKLYALLMQQKIDEKLGLVFKGNREIARLIHRLEKAQRTDGSWGWWDNSGVGNTFMTAYCIHVLGKAGQEKEPVPSVQKGLDDLKFQLPALTGNERLYVMSILSENKALKNAGYYIQEAEKEKKPGTWERYALMRIKQENGMDISKDIQNLIKEKKETVLGGCYWGEQNTEWYDNSAQLSLMAYRILEQEKGQEQNLTGIRRYFLEHSNTNNWRNTYECASILETILPAVIGKYDAKTAKPIVRLSGGINVSIKDYPYTARMKPSGNSIQVDKKGVNPVYLAVYRKYWNLQPEKKEDLYAVRTWFEEDGKKKEVLTAGKVTILKTEIVAHKKADYIMIEIPIPAGCSYNDKKQPFSAYEVHREYMKNKVLIFCESLPAGTWTFELNLQTRYNGNYSLNPAKAELMYFPLFYGRNAVKKVGIKPELPWPEMIH
ncbi:MAG: alpha-2-macroglobulin family protein [Bacteroidia bacterium]